MGDAELNSHCKTNKVQGWHPTIKPKWTLTWRWTVEQVPNSTGTFAEIHAMIFNLSKVKTAKLVNIQETLQMNSRTSLTCSAASSDITHTQPLWRQPTGGAHYNLVHAPKYFLSQTLRNKTMSPLPPKISPLFYNLEKKIGDASPGRTLLVAEEQIPTAREKVRVSTSLVTVFSVGDLGSLNDTARSAPPSVAAIPAPSLDFQLGACNYSWVTVTWLVFSSLPWVWRRSPSVSRHRQWRHT